MVRTTPASHTTRLRPSPMMRVRAAGGLFIAITLTTSLPASAATPSVVDPSGDAAFQAPGFIDIVNADATVVGDTIRFRMSVAASIPAAPPLPPPGTNQIHWDFPVDSDPSTFPAGYPYPSASGQAMTIVEIASVKAKTSAAEAWLYCSPPRWPDSNNYFLSFNSLRIG